MNFNKVEVAGNLTRDPEIKYTPKGTPVAGFSLAVNRYWTNDSGEKQEETTFLDFEAWGKTAEVIGEYCERGHCIFIEGRLKVDQWDDKATGQKRSKVKIVVEHMHFVSKPHGESQGRGEPQGGGYRSERSQGGGRREQSRPPARPAGPPPAKRPPADPDLDAPEDDIPF